MKPSEVKVGDWAVSNEENVYHITNGGKYPIIAVTKKEFVIVDNDGDVISRELSDRYWDFEANSNTQKIIIEVPTKVVVTFEKTEIKNGEEYIIKTFELADLPQLRKDIANDIYNLSNPEVDIVNVKWENQ